MSRATKILALAAFGAASACNSLRDIPEFVEADGPATADTSSPADAACPTGRQCTERWECPGLGDCVCGACPESVEWAFVALSSDAGAAARRGAIEFTTAADTFQVLWTQSSGGARVEDPGTTGTVDLDDQQVTLTWGGVSDDWDGWVDSAGAVMVIAARQTREQVILVRRGAPFLARNYQGGGAFTADDSTFLPMAFSVFEEMGQSRLDGEPHKSGPVRTGDDGLVVMDTSDGHFTFVPSATGEHMLVQMESSDGRFQGAGLVMPDPKPQDGAGELAGRYGTTLLALGADPACAVGVLEFDGVGLVDGQLRACPGEGSTTLETTRYGGGGYDWLDVNVGFGDPNPCWRVHLPGHRSPVEHFAGKLASSTCESLAMDVPGLILGFRIGD